MRLRAHYIFSSGLLSLITVFFIPFLYAVFLAGLISFIGNSFIDYFGHEIKGKYISRTPRTHTVYRSILWGLLLSLPIGVFLYFVFPSFLFVFSVILDGLLVGPSHMILDVFTERGIYHKVNGKWRRIAFAHFSYNNAFVNGLAILLGVIMLFAAMHFIHYYDYHYYHYYNYYS